MISLLDEAFPLAIAFGATGGPERRTDVVPLATGFEARNARWADSRRRYDAGTGIRSIEDLKAVLALFEAARGRLVGFRFRDPFDHSSAGTGKVVTSGDQMIGTGDGVTSRFRLSKTYGQGSAAYKREIRVPLPGSVLLALDGSERQAARDFTLDPNTGEIVFDVPPPTGAILTAGFEFDVPVRFDTDHLEISLTHFEAGDIPTIPLVEIRLD